MKKTKLLSIVAIGVLTVGVGINIGFSMSRESVAQEVNAAPLEPVTLKLNSERWGQAAAYYTIHYWGGDTATSWPGAKFNAGKSASGSVEITANWDPSSTNCIIIRWANSGCSTEWNRWDQYDKSSMTAGQFNYFTNTDWSTCVGSKVETELTKYEINYHDYEGNVVKTEEVNENTEFNPYFFEREGYRLEGWYTEAALENKVVKGTLVTSDMDLYPSYVQAEDYTILFSDKDGLLGSSINAYMWREDYDGSNAAAWPGSAMTLTPVGELYSMTIDASKTYSRIIFNDGSGQTTNVVLSYGPSLYTVTSETDSETKFLVDVAELDAAYLDSNLMASDVEGRCVDGYALAKQIYLALSAAEQELFKTDPTHADAHERYLAWATYHNDTTPFEATSGTRGMLNSIINNQNNMIIVVIVIAASIIGLAVAVRFVKKARKQD